MSLIRGRRWFAFSLRTLFIVVTMFAVWLGWELNFVRQRLALRKQLAAGAGWVLTVTEYCGYSACALPGRSVRADVMKIPFWRRWMGDEPIAQMGFDRGATAADRARARELFPEAYVSDQ